MNTTAYDIVAYSWLDHGSIGSPTSHIRSLTLFRDSVVRPSLHALDAEINSLQASDDPADDFLASDFAELFQRTVEGYLIAVQGMWERSLRGMLILRNKKLCECPEPSILERATWGGKPTNLQSHFLRLMGVPLQAFDSYSDLDLLQSFGSAIRHGDGNAARRVHQLCPSLWWNWFPPGQEIVAGPFRITVPPDGPNTPPFDTITLPESVLEQMIQSVLWFWEDIENMRCNSFRQKHHTVVQRLAAWEADRIHRVSCRFWTSK